MVFHREADREYAATAHDLEFQRPGLGLDFIAAVDEAMTDLRRFPRRWRIIEEDVRRGLLRRFPYAFFYWERIPGKEVEILSIGHSKRHPLHWIARRK